MMKVLYGLWFAFTRFFFHTRYFFHLYRKDGIVQLRTGAKYGRGDLLGEAKEEVRGTAVPGLVRQYADKLGTRLHAWSRTGAESKLGERLYAFELDYGPKTARIGEIWSKPDQKLGNGIVYDPGIELQVLEPVSYLWGPMFFYQNLKTGEVKKTRMAVLWRDPYKRWNG